MKKILLLTALVLLITGCSVREDSAQTSEISPAVPEPEQILAPQAEAYDLQPDPVAGILTISPGDTLARIADMLEEMGKIPGFLAAAQEGDFSEFSLIAAMPGDYNRPFALEGYLFPGEYNIYQGDSADTVIRRILANTERQITEELRKEIEGSGFTIDEIIIIASLIETEAMYNPAYMYKVSSVIHNRLNIGMRLQLCETVFYLRDWVHPFIDGDINRYDEFYCTYTGISSLPAGPIGNPGLDAIRAALNPAETDYLFYLFDSDYNYHFAVTYDVHRGNVQRYLGR